jgi:hypothetical protein
MKLRRENMLGQKDKFKFNKIFVYEYNNNLSSPPAGGDRGTIWN